jgi:hypothetical protein
VRKLLAERTELLLLEDRADAKSDFDASVYPSLLVCRSKPFASQTLDTIVAPATMRCEVHSQERAFRWRCPAVSLGLDDTPGSPWLVIPNSARRAFDRITEAGITLADSLFGRPLLGVKTGCNEAFLVHVDSVDGDIATIRANDRTGSIEKTLLRPVIRGEYFSGAGSNEQGQHVIWPHDAQGQPLGTLPPLARRWFLPYRRRLSDRSDLHNRDRWWSVFRVESASSDRPRVIWADIGRRPRAMVADSGENLVPLNTCYAVRCPTLDDARALAALLNGPLIAAWLDVIAEPARGGYRRYLGWTMALLPIPRLWYNARKSLSVLSSGANPASDAELLGAAVNAYGVTLSEVEPLLAWTGRSL